MALIVSAVTGFTRQAEAILRQPHNFQWTILAFLGLALYIYATEIERKRWDIVLAGLAFWLMDWFNELVNSAILHISNHSALWTVTGPTSYLILIGLSIEISLFFLVAGIIFVKALPGSRQLRIFGIPNRSFLVLVFSCLSVGVEVVLHESGILHWGYWWWNVPFVPLIVVFGYATFYGIAAWVFDMGSNHRKQLAVVGSVAAADAVLALAFGLAGWL
jgi:hypothetical protein